MALNWREQLGVTSDIITNVLDTRYKNLVLIFGPPGGPRRSKRQGVTHSCVSSLWRGVRASFRASFSGSRFGFGALSVAACCSPCGWIGRAPWLRAFPFHELQRFSPSPFPTRISTCSQTLGGKFYHPWGAAAKRKKNKKCSKNGPLLRTAWRSAKMDRFVVFLQWGPEFRTGIWSGSANQVFVRRCQKKRPNSAKIVCATNAIFSCCVINSRTARVCTKASPFAPQARPCSYSTSQHAPKTLVRSLQ